MGKAGTHDLHGSKQAAKIQRLCGNLTVHGFLLQIQKYSYKLLHSLFLCSGNILLKINPSVSSFCAGMSVPENGNQSLIQLLGSGIP